METVPHVVLEYDKWSDCALVALTDGAHSAVRDGTDMPYLVTSGYHRGSRTWARATPFGDITRAKVVFEHRVGRDYTPNEGRLHDDEVIACRWRRGDIAGILEESLDYPIPATKENIDIAIGQIAHVQDRLIEDGWREIVDSIREERLGLGLGSFQADNFYRGVYDVTAHHNSMFWPSGDGSAVHVSHCRLGDGPSFGLTVRTIPVAAIGNEPVTFEKIDRLGGKIELCVDSIDQDIEKVPRLRRLIARRPRLRRTPLRLYPGTERFGRGAKARHLALPAADRAALPAHLAPDRSARDGIGGGERRIRRRGGPAGTSRV